MTAVLALWIAVAPVQPLEKIRVYVFTAGPTPDGYTDVTHQDRQRAVQHLTKQLASQRAVRLVAEPTQADLRIEVMEAGKKRVGRERSTRDVVGLGTTTTPLRDHALHVRLTAGDYTQEIEGVHRVERQAVGAVVDAIKRWVRENERAILNRR